MLIVPNCFRNTVNRSYNILKIAPLKNYRGHFVSDSWVCQPVVVRKSTDKNALDLSASHAHAHFTDFGPKAIHSLSSLVTGAKPSFYDSRIMR